MCVGEPNWNRGLNYLVLYRQVPERWPGLNRRSCSLPLTLHHVTEHLLSTKHEKNMLPFAWKWLWADTVRGGRSLHASTTWKKDEKLIGIYLDVWDQSPILLADPGLRTIILSWWLSHPCYEWLEPLLSSPSHFLWQWWGSRSSSLLGICFYNILVLEVFWDLTNQK